MNYQQAQAYLEDIDAQSWDALDLSEFSGHVSLDPDCFQDDLTRMSNSSIISGWWLTVDEHNDLCDFSGEEKRSLSHDLDPHGTVIVQKQQFIVAWTVTKAYAKKECARRQKDFERKIAEWKSNETF